MQLKSFVAIFSVLTGAAAVSLLVANVSVDRIESNSEDGVRRALLLKGEDWAQVEAEGLHLRLTGIAPRESARFHALTIAGEVVDSYRIRDDMQVAASAAFIPPEFSVEILRNDDQVSLIGLIPTSTDRSEIASTIAELTGDTDVSDMLEAADYDAPTGWNIALAYAIDALTELPHSKISVHPGRVIIEANSASSDDRTRLKQQLSRSIPTDLEVQLDISAPREVVSPFTLRFLREEGQGRFDACFADTDRSRRHILTAAEAAGLNGPADCTIALGNPSPKWGEAVGLALNALAEIGDGSVTFSDADITLIAAEGSDSTVFERATEELQAELPDVFTLHTVFPVSEEQAERLPPEFTVTLSPEGQVQLRGRMTDERTKTAVESYAAARFGEEQIYAATRLDSELPEGWPIRVLSAIEALSFLENGSVVVEENHVSVRGKTGNPNANADIARVLSEKLGTSEDFAIDVEYIEALDPQADLPTPEECVNNINAVLTETKLAFSPGSANIASGSGDTLRTIADILNSCSHVKMEISGYTDSQGREAMNLQLSQSRADAVLNALMARRILTAGLTAKGYGEESPIASNETEAGREANRRIEFILVEDAPAEEDAEGSTGEEQPAETTEAENE